jgi:hypothetical protein
MERIKKPPVKYTPGAANGQLPGRKRIESEENKGGR